MTEILLFFSLIFFVIYHAWYVRSGNKERETWIKALMSKDVHDFTHSTKADEPLEPEAPPEFVETETAEEDLFQKMIDKANTVETELEKADAQSA